MEKKTEDGEPLVKLDTIQCVQESSPDTQESTPTLPGSEIVEVMDAQEATQERPGTEIVAKIEATELSRNERIERLRANIQAMKDQMNDDNLPIV